MESFEALLSSHWAIDLVIACLAVEAIVLAMWFGRPRIVTVLTALLPGLFLLLALRAALNDAPWVMAAFLAASLPAHVVDLLRRPVRS